MRRKKNMNGKQNDPYTESLLSFAYSSFGV